MSTAVVGSNCIVGQNVFIGDGVVLGDRVKVQNNVSIYTGVSCGADVFIGPSVVFTNVINPRSNIERKDQFKDTLVQQGATIGANATIICGNSLGQYCMIGAGSVITKPVKPFALMMGNPARQTGWVSERGLKLQFSKSGTATCPENGETYLLLQDRVIKAGITANSI